MNRLSTQSSDNILSSVRAEKSTVLPNDLKRSKNQFSSKLLEKTTEKEQEEDNKRQTGVENGENEENEVDKNKEGTTKKSKATHFSGATRMGKYSGQTKGSTLVITPDGNTKGNFTI
jgi:hypothetical protein